MKSLIFPSQASVATCDFCGLPTRAPSSPGEPVYCCYGCRFAAGISTAAPQTPAAFGPASALGFSVFFTMNVVMLTMALWSYADEPESPFQEALGHVLRYGAMVFALPVLLLLGRPLFSHAVQGLRRNLLSTDLLLATGVLASFAVSIINTWRGAGHVYYEVGCVILVLVTLGRWLEAAGRSQASAALDQLEGLVPEEVRHYRQDGDRMTPRKSVVVGDLIHILAGERIPLDGRIVRGRGVIDEQFFTGESAPVEKQPGDLLLGGSLNLDGDLIVNVTAPPEAGALGRLVDVVRAARLSKGRYQLLSDQWSQWFFPVISTLALGAFAVHGSRVDWEYGLLTALSVVLIACPCGLALATPLAVWTALGTAAKKGVLFRSGAAIETLAGVRAIRWDKTGTLTTGSPRVEQLLCEDIARQDQVEYWAVLLTKSSHHHFSQAIYEFLAAEAPSSGAIGGLASDAWIAIHADGIQTVPGRGLRARLPDGRVIALGSLRLMDGCGMSWGPRLSAALAGPAIADRPLAAVGFDGTVQGLFVLEESLRPEAEEAIRRCRELGLDQGILTGDRQARALRLTALLNSSSALADSGPRRAISVQTDLLPADKLAAVQTAHQQFGCVAMVGDGLNDAPALAAADIGIALGCGADVSRDSADLCLLSSDLRLVPWAYDYSRLTIQTIRTNLAWSFGYNGIGVIFAAMGRLHPALAAALMVVSSLMVLGNSLRLAATKLGDLPQATEDSLDGIPALGTECATPRKAMT